MANVLSIKKAVITTQKGETLNTIRVYTDGKVAKNTKLGKDINRCGFHLYSTLVNDKRVWYYGVDAAKCPKDTIEVMSKYIAKPEATKKPELSEAEKAELFKKLMKAKKSDLATLLVEAGLA